MPDVGGGGDADRRPGRRGIETPQRQGDIAVEGVEVEVEVVVARFESDGGDRVVVAAVEDTGDLAESGDG
jgi:hypothetical protein